MISVDDALFHGQRDATGSITSDRLYCCQRVMTSLLNQLESADREEVLTDCLLFGEMVDDHLDLLIPAGAKLMPRKDAEGLSGRPTPHMQYPFTIRDNLNVAYRPVTLIQTTLSKLIIIIVVWISTARTKAKSREPAIHMRLTRTNSIMQQVRSRELCRQTVRRLW